MCTIKRKHFFCKWKRIFDVKGVNNRRRNLTGLYVGVLIAERMGWRERHWSVAGLCTLVKPYNMQGQKPNGCMEPDGAKCS